MLSAIGDAVHVLPVVNALKRAWSDCRITWIIQPVPHLLVRGHSAVDEFVLFHRRRGPLAWRAYSDLRGHLHDRQFDLVLALQVYFKANLVTAVVPASRKLGFDRARARDLNWLFTNERIAAKPVQHVQDQYFEFLEHLGVPPLPVEWNIELTQREREAQASFFESLDRPACAVVVGTSKPEKNWHAEGYARVLEELQFTHHLQPVLVGGPSDTERRIADEILSRTKASPLDTLGNDLRKVVYILDGSVLSISPDTGPLHISRALGTPVVGLYGYTNPKRTGPYRAYEDLVVDGYAKSPDERYEPSMEYRDGMKRVSLDAVLEKVDLAVDRYVARP
jgi:heptosyltransferase I